MCVRYTIRQVGSNGAEVISQIDGRQEMSVGTFRIHNGGIAIEQNDGEIGPMLTRPGGVVTQDLMVSLLEDFYRRVQRDINDRNQSRS